MQVISFRDQNASENNNPWPIERQMPVPVDLHGSGLRRLSRLVELHSSDTIATHSTKSIKQSFYKAAALALFSLLCAYVMTRTALVHHAKQKPSLLTTAVDSFHQVNTLYDGTVNCFSTLAQSSEASNETFTSKQALQQPNYHEFVKAMVNEVNDHKKQDHWTCMQRSDIPANTKTIMSIWSFKRKWLLDGTPSKHKACLCAHGVMQTWGTNYWETYTPVVNWASVCLLLAVAKIYRLLSKSIDFVLAFPQADLKVPFYMELQLGFDTPENGSKKLFVLCLNKSLYGLKQAGYNWFAKLSNGLNDRGFT